MEMEVDEGNMANDKSAIFVCCITKNHGLKKTKMQVGNLSDLNLESLRSAVAQEVSSWEGVDEKCEPKNIDILHTSRILKTDEDVKRVGPLSVVTVIKRGIMTPGPNEDHRSAKFIAEYAANRNTKEQVKSCSIALRTAFIHPKFVTMIESLGDSDMLENLFAIVPELKDDPIAIGIIQDPTLIYHLSDAEVLAKVAKSKPWIIEAFNFISASIHQERGGTSQSHGLPSHLLNASLFEEDESMEDDDEDGQPGAFGGSQITREQVAAALSALGGGSAGASGLSSNAFGGLFNAPSTAQPQRSTPNPVASAGANIQNLMNTLAGAGGAIPGQPLNSDTVARAVTEALRRLTPEQRADQLNAIRSFATQLQQRPASSPTTPVAPPQRVVVPPTPRAPPSQSGSSTPSSTLAQQYQSQLSQMREMGITDERLSILALRLSEGDVNTAVELIFSGWTGEGSDPID